MQVVLKTLKGDAFLPPPLLIRLGSDDPLEALMRRQLIAGLELLRAQLDRVGQVMGRATAGLTPGANPFERFAARLSAPTPSQAPPVEPEPSVDEAPPPSENRPPTGGAGEVIALRARINAVEKRFKKGVTEWSCHS